MSADYKNTIYCSFCGKSQHKVQRIIAGPSVYICDECVTLCADICDQGRAEEIARKVIARALKIARSVNRVRSVQFWGGRDG